MQNLCESERYVFFRSGIASGAGNLDANCRKREERVEHLTEQMRDSPIHEFALGTIHFLTHTT
jgi:hypothetical protein